jgi:hypothetical protein
MYTNFKFCLKCLRSTSNGIAIKNQDKNAWIKLFNKL